MGKMKKVLIAFAIIVGLFAGRVCAGDQPWQCYTDTMPGLVVLSSATTASAELAYAIISSTGTTAPNTIYFISGTSTMTYINAPTAAGQVILDFTATPIPGRNGIQMRSNRALDTTCNINVIYRLNPRR